MVVSRSSTCAGSARHLGGRDAPHVAWSDSPIANSCWMTVSWRSMRDALAILEQRHVAHAAWSRALSIATPAAVASATTSSSSTSLKTSADCLSVR